MNHLPPHFDCKSRWLKLEGDDAAIWISLDAVRQVVFARAGGKPSALLWCDDGMWEIGDPAAVESLREWVEGKGGVDASVSSPARAQEPVPESGSEPGSLLKNPPPREKNPPPREKNPPPREKNPPPREKNPPPRFAGVLPKRED